jgi:hypothetical protein
LLPFSVYLNYGSAQQNDWIPGLGVRMKGFKVEGRNGEDLIISHLLFAHETIIFYGVDMENIRDLRCILLCFETFQG